MQHGHSVEEIRARLSASDRSNYLKDCVFGGIDGTITTFAIVAGVQGAGLAPAVILILGVANILADGFSMAAGNYSATKTEKDDIRRIRAFEEAQIRDFPSGEREEIRQILIMKGIEGSALEEATRSITSDPQTWVDMMIADEYGKSPVEPKPMTAALFTFFSFLACGSIPLLPFLLAFPTPFKISILLTALVFAAIGMAKSRWSLLPWWASGFETLAIGSVAAAIAYLAGWLLRSLAAGV